MAEAMSFPNLTILAFLPQSTIPRPFEDALLEHR